MEEPKYIKQQIATCAGCTLLAVTAITMAGYPCFVWYVAAAV